MRHTRAHTKKRRSHHALKAANLSKCTHCGAMHRPHHMCLECGYYNGRQVMNLEADKAKRDARIKAKEERIKNSLGIVPEVTNTPAEVVKEEKEVKPKKVKKVK
jgi:large subunit ribosomal protein L32